MMVSDLIKQLTAGFDLHENADGQYFPVYHGRRRIGQVQLWKPDDRLWLKEPNAASKGLFEVTTTQTWKGGRCEITKKTVKACRQALKLAAAVQGPAAT